MSKYKSKEYWKQIVMFEYYQKEDGKVYCYWRLENEPEYRKELTSFNEIPYVEINLTNKKGNI